MNPQDNEQNPFYDLLRPAEDPAEPIAPSPADANGGDESVLGPVKEAMEDLIDCATKEAGDVVHAISAELQSPTGESDLIEVGADTSLLIGGARDIGAEALVVEQMVEHGHVDPATITIAVSVALNEGREVIDAAADMAAKVADLVEGVIGYYETAHEDHHVNQGEDVSVDSAAVSPFEMSVTYGGGDSHPVHFVAVEVTLDGTVIDAHGRDLEAYEQEADNDDDATDPNIHDDYGTDYTETIDYGGVDDGYGDMGSDTY